MRSKTILTAALALVLASATGALAQQLQYDRTGDHMMSYGTTTAPVGPTQTRAEQRATRHHQASPVPVPLDRTGDHMLYYGPVTQ